MKNKKIVFCGFAATLLMAGTANAAGENCQPRIR